MLAQTSIPGRQLAALALSVPLVIYGGYLTWQTKNVRQWFSTKGHILSFQAKREGRKVKAVIRYSCSAEGKVREGGRITLSDWIMASGEIFVRKLYHTFPVGKEVTVYFDVSN